MLFSARSQNGENHYENNGDLLGSGAGCGVRDRSFGSQPERNSEFRNTSKRSPRGFEWKLHSSANAHANAGHRSPNGIYNSTVGSRGAHHGTNGSLHSSGKRAINSVK
jgi:hypothetical protein